RIGEALNAGVLDVFGYREQPRLDHERPETGAQLLLTKPQVLRDRGTERSAADDDEVERTAAAALPGIDFVDVVAEIPSLDILREGSAFRGFRHTCLTFGGRSAQWRGLACHEARTVVCRRMAELPYSNRRASMGSSRAACLAG